MTDAEAFDRGFVALTYLLGRRESLIDGLMAPTQAARRVVQGLSASDRLERARCLAAELLRIVGALENRSLG